MNSTTSRGRRQRRRSENKRPFAVVGSGMAVLGLLLLFAILVGRAPNGVPLVSYNTIFASVPDPGNIAPHNDVRIGGVRAGQVISIESSANGRALVELRLSGDTELPRDSKVFVRAQGLLGARFIELVPGTDTQMLSERDTVSGGADALTYGVPDALNTFDLKTRRRLVNTVDNLGAGVLGRGKGLNQAFGRLPGVASGLETTADAFLEREGAAERLTPSLGATASALDNARNGTEGFEPAAQALQPFVDKSQAFDRTLTAAPPTLDAARTGLDAGHQLLSSARVLASAVETTLPPAPGALRATTGLLRDHDRGLDRAADLLDDVRPVVPDVLRVLNAASPVLKPAQEALDVALQPIRTLGSRACDVHSFGQAWHSLLGYGIRGEGGQGADLPNGKIGPLMVLRITPVVSLDSVQGIASDPESLRHAEPYSPACKYANGSRYFNTPIGGK